MEPTWLATTASQFLGFHSEKLRLQFARVKTSDWNDHWTILFCVCVCVCFGYFKTDTGLSHIHCQVLPASKSSYKMLLL